MDIYGGFAEIADLALTEITIDVGEETTTGNDSSQMNEVIKSTNDCVRGKALRLTRFNFPHFP